MDPRRLSEGSLRAVTRLLVQLTPRQAAEQAVGVEEVRVQLERRACVSVWERKRERVAVSSEREVAERDRERAKRRESSVGSSMRLFCIICKSLTREVDLMGFVF